MRCQLCVRTTYSTVPKPCEIVLAHTNCASCTKVQTGRVAMLSSMGKSADEERNGTSGKHSYAQSHSTHPKFWAFAVHISKL